MPKEQILDLLWQMGRPLFATVDLARAGDVLAFWAGAPQISSLYPDATGADLRNVTPHLAAVGPDPKVLERTVIEGWGRSWGVYLTCDQSFDKVLAHLRKFVRVRTEDGSVMFFRYYDPRVMRIFLPECNPDEAKEFFGPIKSFWVEDEDPSICLRFERGTRGVIKTAIDTRGRLKSSSVS